VEFGELMLLEGQEVLVGGGLVGEEQIEAGRMPEEVPEPEDEEPDQGSEDEHPELGQDCQGILGILGKPGEVQDEQPEAEKAGLEQVQGFLEQREELGQHS
jgi:hypothetical protein